MDHQPFKTWIILGARLDSSRTEKLQAHLADCQECQQLRDAQRQIGKAFQISPSPEPAPGFSHRWTARMEEREKKARNRLIWILLSGILISLFSLLTIAGLQLRSQLPSLSEVLLIAVHQTARWIYYFNHLWDLAEPLLSVGLKIIPRTWLTGAAVALTALLVIPLLQILKLVFYHEEAVQ